MPSKFQPAKCSFPRNPLSMFLCLAGLAAVGGPALAADGTWNRTAGGTSDWFLGANWVSGTAPGVSGTATTNNQDKATFGSGIAGNQNINLASVTNIKSIEFAGNSFSYTTNPQTLWLTTGGTISVTGGGSGTFNDRIDSIVTLQNGGSGFGSYTFDSSSSNAGHGLNFSKAVSGNATSGNTTTLTLTGVNSGTSLITNTLSDGTNGGRLGITKDGSNTWQIAQNFNIYRYSGPVTINSGTLQSNQGWQIFGAGSVVTLADNATAAMNIGVGSGATQQQVIGSLAGGGSTGGRVLLAGQQLYTGVNNADAVFAGSIQGTNANGGVTKYGTGTQTLAGTNSYFGPTQILGGAIALDFSAATAPATNILSTSSPLNLGGGRLQLVGKAATVNSQSMASTTVAAGDGAVSLNANSATSLLLSLGGITRNTGGTLNVTLPAGTQSSTNGVRTTTTATVNSVLTTATTSAGIAYATVGGTDWAGLSSGNIVAMTNYQTGNDSYTTTNNVDVTNGDVPASGVAVSTLRFNGNNTLNLAGTNTVNTGGILVTSAATTGATISGGTLRPGGGRELVLINNGAQLTVGSVIADSAGGASVLTIAGPGLTILNGNNTYTGNTFINSGTVRLGSSQAIASSSTVSFADNLSAVLELNGNNLTLAGLAGGGAQGTTGQGSVGSSGGTVALGSAVLTVGGSVNADFGGTITGAGGSLVKVGAGTQTLRGANTFTGGVTIQAGVLNAAGFDGNLAALGTGPVTLGNAAGGTDNATLRIGGSVTMNTNYTVSNPIVLAPNTTGTLSVTHNVNNTVVNITGGVTGNNNFVINANNQSSPVGYITNPINNNGNVAITFTVNTDLAALIGSNVNNVAINNNQASASSMSQNISNSGTITNAGTGAGGMTISGTIGGTTGVRQNSATSGLTLSGTNTFTGDTLVSTGTLTLGNNLALQNSGLDTSGAGVINATGRTTPTFGGLIGSTSLSTTNITGYGSITALTLNPQSGKSYTYSGNIGNGAANMTLTKSGSGTQVLSGANSYSGATTVSAGILQFGGSDSLYGGTTASWTATNIRTGSAATLAFNVGGSGEFTTGNVTTLLTNLAASSSATNGMNAGSFLGFDTTNASGGTFTIADAIADTTGASGGARGLRKLGTGSLVLAGISTYTGPTTVSQGGLLVNGQLGNTAVTVQSGGLLGGTGTLLGPVSVEAGGTFSPGNSPGLLSTGELALAGTTLMEIDSLSPSRGVNYDAVDVSGQLTYGGSLLIDFGPLVTTAFANNTTFELFDFTSYTGAFTSITTANDGSWYAGLTFASTGNGDTWKAEKGSQTLEFTYSTGNLVIVPEPGAIALAGIGIAAAGYALRRRSSRGAQARPTVKT
jgi:fibronectin-binding autotransporter adhesin